MSHTIYRGKLHKLISLYECNFEKLMRLVPDLRGLRVSLRTATGRDMELHINVVEHCKYTTIISIQHYFKGAFHAIPNLDISVRLCHDARVAEVISFQRHARFRPIYPYPNRNMYHKDEKYQHNHLLAEWLDYCLKRGVDFARQSGCPAV